MISFIKNKKILRDYKKFLEPRGEFVRDTERVFLAAFREKFPKPNQVHSPIFSHALRGLATSVAVLALAVITSTYADHKDVGVDSALYPLKRISESMRLLLTSESKKTILHSEFAERRLNEIEVLVAEKPQSEKAIKLASDAMSEIKKSFGISNGDIAVETSVMQDFTERAVSRPGYQAEKIPPVIQEQQHKWKELIGEPATPEPPQKSRELITTPTQTTPAQEKAEQIEQAEKPAGITTQTKESIRQKTGEQVIGVPAPAIEFISTTTQETRIIKTTPSCAALRKFIESSNSVIQNAAKENPALKMIFEAEC